MKNCNLKSSCDKASTCKAPCQAFIALHGLNNSGGKQFDAKIPNEYRQTTLETARCREDQSNTYGQLEKYCMTFKKAFNEERNTKETRLKDLFFYSKSSGTGKTETSCAIANEFLNYSYMRSIMLDSPDDFKDPVYYLDMPKLMSLYTKANRGGTPQDVKEDASREYFKAISKAKKARLVVFDELGLRDISDAFCGDIHDLINHRTDNNLTSIFTSNIKMDDLEDVYGTRLFDRIRRYCISYEFVGESKRGIMS